MPDSKTEALTVVGNADKRMVITKKEDAFVPKIKLKMMDGSVMTVPQDANANKNASIILAEVTRRFVAEQIKRIEDRNRLLTPQEIKELVTAAKLVNEMSIVAHEEIMTPTDRPSKISNSAAGQALKTVEAAAKGMAKGNAEAALEKFISMGKKEKQAVIDVVATPVT